MIDDLNRIPLRKGLIIGDFIRIQLACWNASLIRVGEEQCLAFVGQTCRVRQVYNTQSQHMFLSVPVEIGNE